MRYYLEQSLHGTLKRLPDKACNSKAAIEEWMTANERKRGLDWRVGGTIKFRDSDTQYTWYKTKDNTEVKS
jgi:hypothetical protein